MSRLKLLSASFIILYYFLLIEESVLKYVATWQYNQFGSTGQYQWVCTGYLSFKRITAGLGMSPYDFLIIALTKSCDW